MFPKISKYKLIAGKYLSNLSIIIVLIVIYYLILTISAIITYDTIILEVYNSLGIAIFYTIALSILMIFFSAIMPKANFATIAAIVIILVGFPMMEQALTLINQEIEPLFSLNYAGNSIAYVIPGGLLENRRWVWVYYAGDTLPPIKVWVTPTIEMGLIIISSFIITFSFLTLIVVRNKEL
ncbi:MAG: hypothetical protein EU533_04175 [Promethearchaeota archaeon]|nr:MAG: hypothetical protein EU533_04175 [Candidatus Lokiarchaeota archaeon]